MKSSKTTHSGDGKLAMHVSTVSILVNLGLSIFKLLAGVLASSGAMVSDAVHSASDVFSTIIVMIGVSVSGKQSDKEHPYGHERLECIASLLLAIVLFVTGTGIGISGIEKIRSGKSDITVPGMLALVAAIVSIIVKEWMYWYTRAAAKKINSGALMADAWHHRSDALSSIGSFAGVLGSRLGFPVLDPIASVVICLFIIKAAWEIFIDTVNKMVDKSCDDQVIAQMRETVFAQSGVLGIDLLNTRMFGSKVYVDVEITANEDLPLKEAHAIAESVHDAIEKNFQQVKHCMVHVNPASETAVKKASR